MIKHPLRLLSCKEMIKSVGLYFTLISFIIALDTSLNDGLEETKDSITSRISVSMPDNRSLFSGCDVSTVYWGPYRHIDEIHIENIKDLDLPNSKLVKSVERWVKETCHNENMTKISVDIPNNFTSAIVELLTSAGFSRKAFVYRLNKEDTLNLLKGKEISSDGIHTILSTTSPLLPSVKTLYEGFNANMKRPGFFYACVATLLENGGKIFIHQNPQTQSVDGFISYGLFPDKSGNNGILIDSLFVDPNARGQGISYMLINHALSIALNDGANMVYWETGIGRTEAQAFYRKFSIDHYGVAYRYMPSQ